MSRIVVVILIYHCHKPMYLVRYVILMHVSSEITVFWDMTQYTLVSYYKRIIGK
jgi:hypothetical protein